MAKTRKRKFGEVPTIPLTIKRRVMSAGNAWLVGWGEKFLHGLYNQGVEFFQRRYEGATYTMDVWLWGHRAKLTIWGKGEIGFEFFTTGKPVYFDSDIVPGFDTLKNIAVQTSAKMVNNTIKFKSKFGNTHRSVYGSDSSIFLGREAQVQLVHEPLAYLHKPLPTGERRVYADYVSNTFAPVTSHTGMHFRAPTGGSYAGESQITTAYSHSIRDYGYDSPFIYATGVEQQVALYNSNFDWPRAGMKQTVTGKVPAEGGALVEITRTFGIVVDASHKIYVFPLDQCVPSEFTSWPPAPGTGGIPDDQYKEAAVTWPAWVWKGYLGTQSVKNYYASDPAPVANGPIDYPEYDFEFSHDGKKCCAVVYHQGPKIEYDTTYFDYLQGQSGSRPYSLIDYDWIQEGDSGVGWQHYHAVGTVSQALGRAVNQTLPFGLMNAAHRPDVFHWATGLLEVEINIALVNTNYSDPGSWTVDTVANTIIDPQTHTAGLPVAAGYVWYDTVDKKKAEPGHLIWLELGVWFNKETAKKMYNACYGVYDPVTELTSDPPADPYHWSPEMRGRKHLQVTYAVKNHTTGKTVLTLGGDDIQYSFFDWDMKSMSFAVWGRTRGPGARYSVEPIHASFNPPKSFKGNTMGWAVMPIVLGNPQQVIAPSGQPDSITDKLKAGMVPEYNVVAYLLGQGWEQVPLNYGIESWAAFGGTTSSDRLWLVAHNQHIELMQTGAGTPITLSDANLGLKYMHSFGEDWGRPWPDFYFGMATTIRPGWNLHMEELALRTLMTMGSSQSFSVHPTGSYSIFIDHLNYWPEPEPPDLHLAPDDEDIFVTLPSSVTVYKHGTRYIDQMLEIPPETVVVDRIHVRYLDAKGKEVGQGNTTYRECYNRAVTAREGQEVEGETEIFQPMEIADFKPTIAPILRKMDHPAPDPAGDPWPYKIMFDVTAKMHPSYTGLSGWTYHIQEHPGQAVMPLEFRARMQPFCYWTKQHWHKYDLVNLNAVPDSFPILNRVGWLKDIRVDGCWFYGG